MEFQTKARIRIEHWVKHEQDHLEEYRSFARDLRDAGLGASAEAVSEMARLSEQGLESLNKALAGLDG